MKKTANLEIQAKEATGRYEALKATTADGAPIAWFPPKMRTFFSRPGDQQSHRASRVERRFQATGVVGLDQRHLGDRTAAE